MSQLVATVSLFGVSISGVPEPKKVRNKGKNLLQFPNDFVSIDIETTGLSPEYDSIIEISAIKYKNNKPVDRFTSLLKPDDFEIYDELGYLSKFIVELTGITDDMLQNAPDSRTVLNGLCEFVGGSTLLGHNVNFDINFLYDEVDRRFQKEFNNDFVDTMRIARRIMPELKHHRLIDLAEYFNIEYDGAHRALRDCEITSECYLRMIDKIEADYGSTDGFLQHVRKLQHAHDIRAKDVSINMSADPDNPVYGKTFVFTGKLERMTRKEAMRLVGSLGGILADSVTKKTNYLVLGNNDYCTTIKDGKSSKQKKAEKLQLDGHDISTLPEDVFYDMVSEK